MRKEGVVIDYNGYEGMIETAFKERYILLREEIIGEEELKKLDHVMFKTDDKYYGEDHYAIARFVRKLNKRKN